MDVATRWERGSRFYEAAVGSDLFGTPCVVLTWGGVGSAACRRITRPYGSAAAAAAAFGRVAIRRRARGYLLKGVSDDPSPD